jgi:hypothetical protein
MRVKDRREVNVVGTRSETKTPPNAGPAARETETIRGSGFQGIDPPAVLALGRREGQPHLLADGSGEEPAQ